MRKIRIKDIAKMAGVSTATVSRVINQIPDGVGDETREKINQLIKETDYKPNLLAKSMITNKSYTIGLMSSNIMAPFFEEVFKGINDCLRENGYNLLLCNSDDRDDFIAQTETLIARGIDGMILVGFYSDISKEMSKHLGDIPVIMFGLSPENEEITQINTNNEQLAYELAELLLKAGHTKIGVITGQMRFGSVQERLDGFRRALKQHGIEPDESLILHGDFTIRSGCEPAEKLLLQGVTALFCFNDLMAYGAYQVCKKLGKRIPEDVSITGFDGLPYSELISPPLTTAKQPRYQMGLTGSRLLLDIIEGKEQGDKLLILNGQVLERESIALLSDPMSD